MFEPVLHPETIRLGDIVFCQLQPGNMFVAHMIRDIYWEKHPDRYFTIGHQAGYRNKWCQDQHIYGRLIEVVRTEK